MPISCFQAKLPRAEREKTALALLKATSGVVDAALVPRSRLERLVEPWLGVGAHVAELPLPALIEVHLAEDARIDFGTLGEQLRLLERGRFGADVDDPVGGADGVLGGDHIGPWCEGRAGVERGERIEQLAERVDRRERRVGGAQAFGHARGVALLVCTRAGLGAFEYAPARVKRTVTGAGRADKSQVAQMVRVVLGLPDVPRADAADALAIALTGTYYAAAMFGGQDGVVVPSTQEILDAAHAGEIIEADFERLKNLMLAGIRTQVIV